MNIFCMFSEREGNKGNSKCDNKIRFKSIFQKYPNVLEGYFSFSKVMYIYIFQYSKIFQLRDYLHV